MVTKTPQLFGLVLAGGRSRRMGRDKSRINYYDKEQRVHCFELLAPLCEKIFLSTRQSQRKLSSQKNFPQIHDRPEFSNIGPLGGILSAMKKHPEVAWLVLACDLPFVDRTTLQSLIRQRNSRKVATAYANPDNGLPEPLCAIYEPGSLPALERFFKKNISCPRKILINSDMKLLRLKNRKALKNINTITEYNGLKRNSLRQNQIQPRRLS